MPSSVVPFQRKKQTPSLRKQVNGIELLAELNKNFKALTDIDAELANSIQEFEKNTIDTETGEVITSFYKSTILDKETIAVYHTRQAGRKMQIDAIMKMLNKVLPDLRAIETSKDVGDKAAMALAAFAQAAAEECVSLT